jgi:hypothetical protein
MGMRGARPRGLGVDQPHGLGGAKSQDMRSSVMERRGAETRLIATVCDHHAHLFRGHCSQALISLSTQLRPQLHSAR